MLRLTTSRYRVGESVGRGPSALCRFMNQLIVIRKRARRKSRVCGGITSRSTDSGFRSRASRLEKPSRSIAERNHRFELEKLHAGMPREKSSHRIRTVAVAVKEYQIKYSVSHRAKSITWVQERLKHVERLLRSSLVPDLTEARLAEYMAMRLKEGAGNRAINMEIDCLARAVGHPWRTLWPTLKRQEETRDVGRALSHEQEQKLLECAARNKSPLVLPFIRIALLAGMRLGEIRNLRWNRVDLVHRTDRRQGED